MTVRSPGTLCAVVALLAAGMAVGRADDPAATRFRGTGKADLKLKSLLVGQLRGGDVTEIGQLTLSTNALNHLDISGSSIVCVEDNAVTIPAVVAIGWNAGSGTANGTFTIGNLDALSKRKSGHLGVLTANSSIVHFQLRRNMSRSMSGSRTRRSTRTNISSKTSAIDRTGSA